QDQAKSGGLDKGAASAGDIQKLQQALNQPPAEANAASGVNQAQAPDKVDGVQGAERTSPGSKILDSMNNMRTGMQEAVSELHKALSGELNSPAELMRVQMNLQQVTMQTDLASKVVSKT